MPVNSEHVETLEAALKASQESLDKQTVAKDSLLAEVKVRMDGIRHTAALIHKLAAAIRQSKAGDDQFVDAETCADRINACLSVDDGRVVTAETISHLTSDPLTTVRSTLSQNCKKRGWVKSNDRPAEWGKLDHAN